VAILIYVISPTRVYREALGRELERTDIVSVIGGAASAAEAVPEVARGQPQVVLIDLPWRVAFADVRCIRRAAPPVKFVALAVPDSPHELAAWAQAGVNGCVAHDACVMELLEAIKAASRGDVYCSATLTATLFRTVARFGSHALSSSEEDPSQALTNRELEVLLLVDEGYTTKQISSHLSIAVPTVKNHVRNICGKLNVTTRVEAALLLRVSASAAAANDHEWEEDFPITVNLGGGPVTDPLKRA
jgi:two-component system NarL family response regulator